MVGLRSDRRCYASCLSPASRAGGCFARGIAAASRALCRFVWRPRLLAFLQLTTYDDKRHFSDFTSDWFVARKHGERRHGALWSHGRLYRAAHRRHRFYRLAGPRRLGRELHFGIGYDRLQARCRDGSGQHTIAKALWRERWTRRCVGMSWRFLWAHQGDSLRVPDIRLLGPRPIDSWEKISAA